MNAQKELAADFKRFYKLGKNGVLQRKASSNSYVTVQARALKRLQIVAAKMSKRFE